MILKITFAAREEGEGPTVHYFDDVTHVAQYGLKDWVLGENSSAFSRSRGWRHPWVASSGFDKTTSEPHVWVAVLNHSSDLQTCIEIYDNTLLGIWLMSDEGGTIDNLYRSW